MSKNTNREEWLGRLVEALRPMFADQGAKLPKKIRVSCGWPGGGSSRKRIGEAWSAECSADDTHETFISPSLDDAVRVADVLVHELVHHAVGTKEGHKRPFARLAKALGLEGKMTATVAGKELKAKLEAITYKLGHYPHAALSLSSNTKKQSTRMLKVECNRKECGCVLRMTKKWLEDVGAPRCGCGGTMTCVDLEDEGEE
jgi:hypothetical protein